MTTEGLSLKGQSSVEFLMIVGIALAVSAPFVLNAQRSIIDIQQTQDAVKVQNSLDKMEEAVNTVSLSGEPARRTFNVDMPDDVVKARVIQNKSIVYTLNRPSGIQNVSRTFDTDINTLGEGLPEEGGRITVYAWNNQVNISEVGFNGSSDGEDAGQSVPTPYSEGLFYVENQKVKFLDTSNDSISTVYSKRSVRVIGPQNSGLDGDPRYEIPFVTSDKRLWMVDSKGETQKLSENPRDQKSKLGLDTSSAEVEVMYPGDSNNNYEIYSASLNSSAKEVVDPDDGVSAVAGTADFDADNETEIVFVDESQTLQYVDKKGKVKSTGQDVGSNNGLGLGNPYDFNNDGVPRTPIVDGGNNIALVNYKGKKEQVTENGPARKTSIAVIDIDDDAAKEIAFISEEDDSAKYVEGSIGNNGVKNINPTIYPDTETGLTARKD